MRILIALSAAAIISSSDLFPYLSGFPFKSKCMAISSGNPCHIERRYTRGTSAMGQMRYLKYRVILFLFCFELDQPFYDFIHDSCIERIIYILPILFSDDQVSLLQQIKVMRNARAGNLKSLYNFPCSHILILQELQNLSPGRVIQGFEDRIHASVGSLVI